MNKKALFIIIGTIVAIVLIGVLFFVLVFKDTKKLECKSSQGNITLRYNDKKVVGYTAKNFTYELDAQNKIASQVGIDAYIEQFKLWFANNTDGTCE